MLREKISCIYATVLSLCKSSSSGGSLFLLSLVIFQFNTITENLDLSDNYVEGEGAAHIARMLKENAFITSLVSEPSVGFRCNCHKNLFCYAIQ